MSGGGHMVWLILLSVTLYVPSALTRAESSKREVSASAFAALKDSAPPPAPSQSQSLSQEYLQLVEAGLLKMFGLLSRPQPDENLHIPQYITDLYKNHVKNPDDIDLNFKVTNMDTFSANTIRSFLHKELDEEPQHRISDSSNGQRHTLHFNISTIGAQEDLTAAELRLYRDINNTDLSLRRTSHRISVYEILRPGGRRREPLTRLIDTRLVNPQETTWESFDVRPAVLKWRQAPHEIHGLEVHVSTVGEPLSPSKHVRLRRSAPSDATWEVERPILVTYSDDRQVSSSRTRRGAKKRNKNKRSRNQKQRRRGQCQRQHLYVDFNQVGWQDWIIAPPGYHAYFCAGECDFPIPDHLNTTNHAIVQNLVHSVDPKSVPKACCVPTELSPISMLYKDDGTVVLKNYQGMVVEGCGCR